MRNLSNEIQKIPIKPEKTSTVRVAFLEDIRGDIEALAGLSEAQKLLLYQKAGFASKPNDQQIIGLHISHVFNRKDARYRNDRYSKGFNAFYSSMNRETAECEVRYHSRVDFYKPSRDNTFEFSVFSLSYNGALASLIELCQKPYGLMNSTLLDKCQFVGKYFSSRTSGILVSSVRAAGVNQVTYNEDFIEGDTILGSSVISVKERSNGRYTKVVRIPKTK